MTEFFFPYTVKKKDTTNFVHQDNVKGYKSGLESVEDLIKGAFTRFIINQISITTYSRMFGSRKGVVVLKMRFRKLIPRRRKYSYRESARKKEKVFARIRYRKWCKLRGRKLKIILAKLIGRWALFTFTRKRKSRMCLCVHAHAWQVRRKILLHFFFPTRNYCNVFFFFLSTINITASSHLWISK